MTILSFSFPGKLFLGKENPKYSLFLFSHFSCHLRFLSQFSWFEAKENSLTSLLLCFYFKLLFSFFSSSLFWILLTLMWIFPLTLDNVSVSAIHYLPTNSPHYFLQKAPSFLVSKCRSDTPLDMLHPTLYPIRILYSLLFF